MTDMRLTLRITGDANGLKAEIVGAKREVDGLGASGRQAGGQVAAGMESIAATATRAIGVLAGFGGAAATILRVARAGDEMNASLGRLAIATGSAQGAADVYERLYRLSLQTGVATSEAAGAFNRFAIAAREAGATQEDVLAIVQILQQAGSLAGATTQEISSTTVQLAQGLSRGALQAEELNSVMESMPNLAAALARELGVGLGQLRGMGEQGKLTADVVIPALRRAAAGMAEEFRALPPSLSRSMDVLGVASRAFLADLDSALGLSRRLAGALSDAAGALDRVRQRRNAGGAGLDQATFDAAERAAEVANLRRQVEAAERRLQGEEIDGVRQALPGGARRQLRGALTTLRERLAEAERLEVEANQRLEQVRREAGQREAEGDEARRQAGQAAAREAAARDIGALRLDLDRRLRIRQEAAEREQRVETALNNRAIDAAEAQRLRADIRRQMDQELAGLNRPARQEPDALASYVRRGQELRESLQTPMERYNAALDEAITLNNLFEASQGRIGISTETMRRYLARAEQQLRESQPVDQEAARYERVLNDLGRIGEQAFDNVGRSITQALAQGQMDFRSLRNIGMAVASELTQAFLRLAIINPIRNAVFGGNLTTFGDLVGAVGRWWSGGSAAAGAGNSIATVGGAGFTGGTFHTGGIVGADAVPGRAVPSSLYSTAPRFHGGRAMIGPDEVPAILRRGEGVFTPEQMDRLGPAGGSYTFAPTVYFQGDAGSDQDRRQLVAQMQAMWRQDLATLAPGIISASRAAIVGDIERRGVDAALGLPA